MIKILIIAAAVFLSAVPAVHGWDSAEMEVFDVVEEVNENFYELMGISPDAALPEIKKAYRTLSKQIHPDKSDAPDAEIKFRQLVSVYEVLKDPEHRGHYDRVLVEGLPDWRSAVYYYRRARKMSMLEICFILTLVISVSQYLMAWGTYWDTWKTLDDALSRKYRNRGKQKKKGGDDTVDPLEDALSKIPTPSMMNVLPVQLCRGSYYLVRYGPSLLREWREDTKRREQLRLEEEETEREEQRMLKKEEEERRARKAAPKRRRQQAIPEKKKGGKGGRAADIEEPEDTLEAAVAAGLTTGLWSNEEFCDLAKLMNKFPGGTVDRWEVIAEHLNRSSYEVIKMAHKVREKLAAGTWLQAQEETVQAKIKIKTRAVAADSEDASSSDANWSAVQQKSLEKGLKSFPKGTDQRWEKMAKQVPDKTAEECINRFKYLAEKIRKKKREEDEAAKLATQRDPADDNVAGNEEDNQDGSNDEEDDSGQSD